MLECSTNVLCSFILIPALFSFFLFCLSFLSFLSFHTLVLLSFAIYLSFHLSLFYPTNFASSSPSFLLLVHPLHCVLCSAVLSVTLFFHHASCLFTLPRAVLFPAPFRYYPLLCSLSVLFCSVDAPLLFSLHPFCVHSVTLRSVSRPYYPLLSFFFSIFSSTFVLISVLLFLSRPLSLPPLVRSLCYTLFCFPPFSASSRRVLCSLVFSALFSSFPLFPTPLACSFC